MKVVKILLIMFLAGMYVVAQVNTISAEDLIRLKNVGFSEETIQILFGVNNLKLSVDEIIKLYENKFTEKSILELAIVKGGVGEYNKSGKTTSNGNIDQKKLDRGDRIDLVPDLIEAVKNNQPTMVKKLIKEGIDVNARIKNKSALNTAAYRGYNEIIKILVSAGGKLNGVRGTSAIEAAYFEGKYETAKLLLDLGADPNELLIKASTGAFFSSELINWEYDYSNHYDFIDLALEYGASIYATSEFTNTTPLINSVKCPGYEKHDDVHIDRCDFCLDVTDLLIDEGAYLNTQDINGNTALIYAVEYKNYDAVTLLVDAGANLNLINNYGRTALQKAKEGENSKGVVRGKKDLRKIIKYLEEAGAK